MHREDLDGERLVRYPAIKEEQIFYQNENGACGGERT